MTKKLILSALLVLGVQQSAEACSYVINDVGAKNDLAAAALTHLGVTIDKLHSTEVSQYRWFESKPTPMCPEEITYESTYKLGYELSSLVGCSATVKVTKIEPWKPGKRTEYKFEVLSAQSCE